MYKLSFFVPSDYLDAVKQAVFAVGAGKIGDYDQCCWQVLGEGQFRPLTGSAPFIGQQLQLETVPEYKVEMVCDDKVVTAAVAALKASHPYETPAYDVVRLESY
jgi:hypothetical protein